MKDTCESLFSDFLYQCWPWPTTYSNGRCGHPARGGSVCNACLARRLKSEYGIDVTTPQWSWRDDGTLKTNWHPSRPNTEDDE